MTLGELAELVHFARQSLGDDVVVLALDTSTRSFFPVSSAGAVSDMAVRADAPTNEAFVMQSRFFILSRGMLL